MLRFLPGLLAIAALASLGAAVRDFEAAVASFSALRQDVLVDPVAARDAFCAAPAPAGACAVELARGRDAAAEAACATSWSAGPPRYYSLRLRCFFPKWAGGMPLPLLEALLFR